MATSLSKKVISPSLRPSLFHHSTHSTLARAIQSQSTFGGAIHGRPGRRLTSQLSVHAHRAVAALGGCIYASPVSLSAADHSRRYSTDEKGKNSRNQQATPPDGTPKKPIQDTIEATKERTRQLTNKVKSSITSLRPHENIYTIPNILTASRLVAAPVIGYLVLQGDLKWAVVLFAYAGITDLVDGWMARRYKLQTVVGSVIDPMADKVLMTVLTVTLAVKGFLPLYLATLILGRDITLATAAIYYRYASLPSPKTFTRYWDFSLPSAEVHPTTLSKYNTFLQLLLIGSTLILPVLTADSHHLGIMGDLGLGGLDLEKAMTGFQILVAGTTAWSGLSYSVLKDAVTILGTDEKLKARQGRRGRAIIGAGFGSFCLFALWLAMKERREGDDDDQDELVLVGKKDKGQG